MALSNSFFFATLHQSSEPFIHLFLFPLNRLWRFPPPPAALNATHCKGTEGLPQLLSIFQVLIFLHTTKNWKDSRLPLAYLWSKLHTGLDNWHTLRTYVAYFYWCTHDFRHAYFKKYTHFFPKIFLKLFKVQNFSVSFLVLVILGLGFNYLISTLWLLGYVLWR